MTREGSRALVSHHGGQAGHEVDADVTGCEFAVQALARQTLLMSHCVQISGCPIGLQRSLKSSAVQVLRAPLPHVGIDELRPQTDEVGRSARAGVDVELERNA